jgi:hypothetical protein
MSDDKKASGTVKPDNKDPNGELEHPAPLEQGQPTAPRPKHNDLEGQQGGQEGGGREPL